ncbi:hypothetical protein BU16DRAFT_528961 [Lophium mytilinum]|uniref:Uncharacterized protein n=1 Tax=Lophium mytilinum TaxID=390894 RepID=A0A6A6QK69_9PEZI|nr:hypothetical protein BU16DRAFT_528961 [Lophium mytilinum]
MSEQNAQHPSTQTEGSPLTPDELRVLAELLRRAVAHGQDPRLEGDVGNFDGPPDLPLTDSRAGRSRSPVEDPGAPDNGNAVYKPQEDGADGSETRAASIPEASAELDADDVPHIAEEAFGTQEIGASGQAQHGHDIEDTSFINVSPEETPVARDVDEASPSANTQAAVTGNQGVADEEDHVHDSEVDDLHDSEEDDLYDSEEDVQSTTSAAWDDATEERATDDSENIDAVPSPTPPVAEYFRLIRLGMGEEEAKDEVIKHQLIDVSAAEQEDLKEALRYSLDEAIGTEIRRYHAAQLDVKNQREGGGSNGEGTSSGFDGDSAGFESTVGAEEPVRRSGDVSLEANEVNEDNGDGEQGEARTSENRRDGGTDEISSEIDVPGDAADEVEREMAAMAAMDLKK